MEEGIKYCHVPIEKDKSFFYDHVHIVWDEQISYHQHVEWELSYIVTGSGSRVIGDVVETFSPGEVVLIPSNIPHCWSFDANHHDKEGKIENITIIFPESLFDKCRQAFPEAEPPVSKLRQCTQALKFEGATEGRLQKIMMAMRWQNDLERLSSLLHLFSVIAASDNNRVVGSHKKHNKSAGKMQEIYRFIFNSYQRPISLDDVANHMGMNRASFCNFFKRVTGKSFFTMLNEYRIDASCLMLRETTIPIADICYAVGFNDIPYYNRTFKKLKGVTPKDYRAKNKLEALVAGL